jgi:carbonic anhydrase/acetyltransferase-like protein (isoleucine patch superfamily)
MPPLFYRFVLALLFVTAHTAVAQQNVTVVGVDVVDRLTNGTSLGAWNTDGNLEGWIASSASGLGVTRGLLVGDDISNRADASISLNALANGPDLDLGFNDYLQIRIKLPGGYTGDVRFEFGTSTDIGFATSRQFVLPSASIPKDGAFHTYRLDMGLEVFWRDNLRDLRVTPIVAESGHFEIDYIEVGDVAGTAPALNLDTNFPESLSAATAARMESKHVCVWWNPADTSFTPTHARRALRMCEESYQVYCKKLGYNEPFLDFKSATGPRSKVNFVTWYGGFWAGGHSTNRGYLNVGWGGLGDEGWGNPVPHEFGHVIQMHQPGFLTGGQWESHANYLRAARNLHFFAAIPNAIPAIDNLTGNSNYRPDHKRHIYQDQRYYLSLDDYGTQFGLPQNFSAKAWRDGAREMTLIEKLALALPVGASVKDVALECCKRWPMLDFVEKARLRAQHWGTESTRAEHFWKQGAQLIPLQDQPGWWRVPLERAPDSWAYQMHDLTASPGATITVELRGLDLAGAGEDWRWCLAAISAGDTVRYSPVWAPGTQSFTLNANETQAFLIVAATPATTALELESLSNTKPIDKHADRLRYAYEVRLLNAAPAPHPFQVANPAGYRTHGNGGGIVGPSATVSSTAYVGPNAKVLGSAQVLGTARVEDYAVVQGSATVQGLAIVSGSALVEASARVEGQARVRDRAQLGRGAVVRGRALVGGYSRIDGTTIQDDAIVRGCAQPLGGILSGTAIADHDYSMWWSVSDGVHFSHIPWGGWWDAFYAQSLTKPRGLIASYRTEEPDGALWWDEFGALHAVLRGAPEHGPDAAFNSPVMTFDGLDDYAVLDRSLADAPALSFSCWVKPANAMGAEEPLLFLGKSAVAALKLVRNAAGNAVLSVSNGETTATLTSTSRLTPGAWQHLAFSLDGSNARLYVGGAQEASASTTLTPLDVLAANGPTAMQANYLGRGWSGSLFKGSFEDVRFYNVPLTATEVRQELTRRGDLLAAFSPVTPADFNGASTIAQSGARNGRVRTLSAWVKPRASQGGVNYEAVFDSGNELAGGDGSGFGLQAGQWMARLDGAGLWPINVSAALGKWQHVALAFNGSTANFFLNGVRVATRSYTGPVNDSAAQGKCFRVGYSQHTGDTASREFFDGLILNARVHESFLSASQLVLDSDGDGFNDNVEADFASSPIDPQNTPSHFLAGLVPSAAGLSPAFSRGVTQYSLRVPYDTPFLTVTPTTADVTASVKVNGAPVSSGTPSAAVPLQVGLNTVSVVVTPQANAAPLVYTVSVTRTAPSANADLSELVASTGTLSPVFRPIQTSYTLAVPYSVESLRLAPLTVHSGATVKVNGASAASGAPSAPVALAVGANTLSVVVKAEDATTTKTYAVVVTRLSGPRDAGLAALTSAGGALSPVFDMNTASYRLDYATPVISTRLLPVTRNPDQRVTVNGKPVASGEYSADIALPVGESTIQVVVTAPDGVTQRTYTVGVRRPASAVANLSSLKLSSGTLSPAFSADTRRYSVLVPNTVNAVNVTAEAAQPRSVIRVGGVTVPSGRASAWNELVPGENAIAVVVTAEDGVTTKTYTLLVTRQPEFGGAYDGVAEPVAGTLDPGSAVALVALNVTRDGAFTGTLLLGGREESVSLRGAMNVSGLARFGNRATTESLQIRTPGRPTLAISMRMDVRFPFTHQIVGTLSSNSRRVADFVLNRRLYSTAANPVAPLITVPRSVLDPATDNGRYTAFFKALLPAEQGLRNTEYPQGDGWAVFTVRSSGAVSMVGELGDGQVFSYTNYLSLDRVLPFYVALPGGRGSASGRITFRDVPGQSDADAVGLRWFKRANSADGSYPRGWPGGIRVDFLASKFLAPALTQKTVFGVAPVAAPSVNAVLSLTGGGVPGELVNRLAVGPGEVIDQGAPVGGSPAPGVLLELGEDGTIEGQFQGAGSVPQIRGAVFQKTRSGHGYFLAAPAPGATKQSGKMKVATP